MAHHFTHVLAGVAPLHIDGDREFHPHLLQCDGVAMAAWQRRLRSRLGCVAESGNRLNLPCTAPPTPIRRTVNLSHSKAGGSRARVIAFRKTPIRTGIRRPIMTLRGLLM